MNKGTYVTLHYFTFTILYRLHYLSVTLIVPKLYFTVRFTVVYCSLRYFRWGTGVTLGYICFFHLPFYILHFTAAAGVKPGGQPFEFFSPGVHRASHVPLHIAHNFLGR